MAHWSLFCQIERRLDAVRSMCHHSHKRLTACFQGQHGMDAERRHVSIRCDSESEMLCLWGAFLLWLAGFPQAGSEDSPADLCLISHSCAHLPCCNILLCWRHRWAESPAHSSAFDLSHLSLIREWPCWLGITFDSKRLKACLKLT